MHSNSEGRAAAKHGPVNAFIFHGQARFRAGSISLSALSFRLSADFFRFTSSALPLPRCLNAALPAPSLSAGPSVRAPAKSVSAATTSAPPVANASAAARSSVASASPGRPTHTHLSRSRPTRCNFRLPASGFSLFPPSICKPPSGPKFYRSSRPNNSSAATSL